MMTPMDSLTRFNRQVLQCQDEAYTLAWYLTGGNETQAEAVTQEAVIAAYRCYTAQGGNCRRLVLKYVLHQSHQAASQPVPVTGIYAGADLDQVAALRADRLLSLPEPERQALVLVTILGLNYTEASAVAGIPVERLRRLLAQALRKVRTEEVAFQGFSDRPAEG